MSLSNKIVIVTGASSGIGEACAKAFALQNAQVVLASRNIQELERVASEMKGTPLVVGCDVGIRSDCENLIETCIQKFGRIDVLICNAGISMRARFLDCSMEVLDKLMQVNFWGSVYCSKYALPYLLKSKGSIVVISTTGGFVGLPGRTGYSASKFALFGFFDSLRSEHLRDGLHITIVFPGFVASNIRKNALNANGSAQGNSPKDESKMTSPETVATRVIQAVNKRKRKVLIGGQTRRIWWFRMFFPATLEKIIHRKFAKEKDSPFQ